MSSVIKFVQQTDNTCVHACIAMIANMTLEEVLAEHPDFDGDSTPDTEVFALLYRLDIEHIASTNSSVFPGRYYIMTCASLNREDVNHTIVVASDKEGNITIYDPNTGKEGFKSYTKLPKCWGSVIEFPLVENYYHA